MVFFLGSLNAGVSAKKHRVASFSEALSCYFLWVSGRQEHLHRQQCEAQTLEDHLNCLAGRRQLRSGPCFVVFSPCFFGFENVQMLVFWGVFVGFSKKVGAVFWGG